MIGAGPHAPFGITKPVGEFRLPPTRYMRQRVEVFTSIHSSRVHGQVYTGV